MATVETLLTAEEYRLLPDDGRPRELVRGRVVPVNMPAPRHGEICANVVLVVGGYVAEKGLGRVICNDSGVVTERGPDTVRGADVAYYSFRLFPPGPLPDGYLPVPPELVFEVRSPGDRWRDVLAKVVEYLDAGVRVVVVLDPGPQAAHVYYPDQPDRIFRAEEELAVPEVLGEFRAPVRRFFA